MRESLCATRESCLRKPSRYRCIRRNLPQLTTTSQRLIHALEIECQKAIEPTPRRLSPPPSSPKTPCRSRSSSTSSASTDTATPASPRPGQGHKRSLTASSSTATIRPSQSNGNAGGLKPLTPVSSASAAVTKRNGIPNGRTPSPLPIPPSAPALQPFTSSNPPSLGLILRRTAQSYIQYLKSLNLHALFLLLIPLALYLWQLRRMRVAKSEPSVAGGGSGGPNAVRRRLKGQNVGGWWSEVVRVVGDTVGMAGRGLV